MPKSTSFLLKATDVTPSLPSAASTRRTSPVDLQFRYISLPASTLEALQILSMENAGPRGVGRIARIGDGEFSSSEEDYDQSMIPPGARIVRDEDSDSEEEVRSGVEGVVWCSGCSRFVVYKLLWC